MGILLLLTERLHFAHGVDGCEWCQGGTLNNPETLIALTTPDQVRSCQEWQQTSSLTENLSDETCIFVGPFYEAICGCSNLSPIYDQCDLCGSPEMVFSNPSKGLMIPNSNSQQVLCGTIYSGVQMGGIPTRDCQVLAGITDYCGGCVPATAEAAETSDPTISPTDVPTVAPTADTLAPSMAPSMAPSIAPSMETLVSISESPALSSRTTMQPSIVSTGISTGRTVDRPTIEQFVILSATPATCDLCPPIGTLSRPDKLISLVSTANQTITKSCGALLWDTRAGRDDIDASACSFLQPFFGAICGCSTFRPFFNDTDQTEIGSSIGNDDCKICDNSIHAFQAPYKSLGIPGSNTSRITCGGLFLGAVSGAITTDECEILSGLTNTCGGCGVEKASFYVEPPSKEEPKQVSVLYGLMQVRITTNDVFYIYFIFWV